MTPLEFRKGPFTPSQLRDMPDSERDRIIAERKVAFIETIKGYVEEEKGKNPNFTNIDMAFLDKLIKSVPEAFVGTRGQINSGGSLMRSYFGSDINNLRRNLGLPEIKRKEKYF